MRKLRNDELDRLTVDQWRTGLTGNLCRCTGYPKIFEANKEVIKDPDLIYPGQVIRLTPPSGMSERSASTTSMFDAAPAA